MGSTVSEIIWIRGLLNELGVATNEPTTLCCDNKVVLQIVSNPMFHVRTKHVEIDCNFIREKLQLGIY